MWKKRKQNPNEYPEEDLDNLSKDVSVDDQIKYSEIGRKIERKKKIKRWVFFGLSIVGITTVVVVAFSIKPPKNELRQWKADANIIKYDKIKDYVTIANRAARTDISVDDMLKSLSLNPSLENKDLEPYGIKILDSNYAVSLYNISVNTYKKDIISFDIYLSEKFNPSNFAVITNFELTNLLPTKAKPYGDKDAIKSYLDNLSFSLTLTSSEKVEQLNETNKILAKINSETDILLKNRIFLENFKVNNLLFGWRLFEFEGNLETEIKDNAIFLKFKSRPYRISRAEAKYGTKKYVYAIYETIEDSSLVYSKALEIKQKKI
ncbi:hypothetical protein JN00_0586 [Metamycoplasma subdolum]|uniref:Uncharacterized protein n=1 Tax=Metamycoplasma subdolum TaxID=92407 RepID=A0A3L9ZX27_9BACT|nr:hypothetical protein [Metamycoplasma subdolum]RMA77421.1 hypothetical protein JN00_0586 [Metamycoplasma subdolum]WPB50402.1 hypothetical protein R9C05_02245 [Metamycoplasma subdolum]